MKHKFLAGALLASVLWGQNIELVPVVAKPTARSVDLPGEFQPYLSVTVHARVPGYVERIPVDRGSFVKAGDLIAELSAPEMAAQIAEQESKVQAAESDRLQAEAQLAAVQSTYDRLKKASETPGAIAGNELIQVEKQVEATQALIRSREEASRAAKSSLKAMQEMQGYLKITAPFEGVVTERMVHPGALVGPSAGNGLVMLQQISKLRLVVAVPEEDSGRIPRGARVEFHVAAYPGRTFVGNVARSAHSLDEKTRTMAVELDVANSDGALSPGMYPTVKWPIERSRPSLLVPPSAVVTTSERMFVIRDRGGRAEWVDVKKGPNAGDLIEVMGALLPGDKIVRRATDEIRDGTPLRK